MTTTDPLQPPHASMASKIMSQVSPLLQTILGAAGIGTAAWGSIKTVEAAVANRAALGSWLVKWPGAVGINGWNAYQLARGVANDDAVTAGKGATSLAGTGLLMGALTYAAKSATAAPMVQVLRTIPSVRLLAATAAVSTLIVEAVALARPEAKDWSGLGQLLISGKRALFGGSQETGAAKASVSTVPEASLVPALEIAAPISLPSIATRTAALQPN